MQPNPLDILATKQLEPGLIALAAAQGIIIDCIPFIATQPVIASGLKDRLLFYAGSRQVVVFTSAHAVNAIAAGIDPRGWEVFCLGGATKKAVEAAFPHVLINDTADSAAALAQKIISANIHKLIFFCGDRRREELPALLGQNHIETEEVIVYETVLTPVRLDKKYSGVLFFSPSAVESFLTCNGLAPDTVLFAIGKTTASALESHGRKPIVSEQPDPKILISKLISHFQAESHKI